MHLFNLDCEINKHALGDKMVLGAVFDMDGTLIDTVDIISRAWEYAFSEQGIKTSGADIRAGMKGADAKDFVASLGVDPKEKLMSELKQLRKGAALRELEKPTLYPDARETLDTLRSMGVRLAIATSMSRDMLEITTKANGLDKIMDAVVSAEDVPRGKPFPDVFLEAFKQINVDPHRGIVVGDSRRDIIPANEIGAFSIYVDREGSMDCDPNAVIRNLSELPPLVNDLRKKAGK